MARTRLIFGKTAETRHGVAVDGDPEKVVEALQKQPWGHFNRAGEGKEPDWIWVNRGQVLYVEAVRRSVHEAPDVTSG